MIDFVTMLYPYSGHAAGLIGDIRARCVMSPNGEIAYLK